MKKNIVTRFFTRFERIVVDVLPKGSKFNQLDFIDHLFPDLKRENLNFHRRKPELTFCVHVDNSTCHAGSKVASKFEKYHILRLPHPPYWPEIRPCDCRLSGLLKGMMNDREFHSDDEIEKGITIAWNDLIFEDVQNIFSDWMRRLAWIIEHEGEYLLE
jgi:hypothetical protein